MRAASIYYRLEKYEEAINHSKIAENLALELYGKDSEQYARSLQNTSVYYLGEVILYNQ